MTIASERRPLVLVVDDDDDHNLVMTMSLEALGYEVRAADSCAAAQAVAASEEVDALCRTSPWAMATHSISCERSPFVRALPSCSRASTTSEPPFATRSMPSSSSPPRLIGSTRFCDAASRSERRRASRAYATRLRTRRERAELLEPAILEELDASS